MISPGIDVVIFDWDGTLVDTGGILLSCWHTATESVLGYRFPVEESDRRRVLAMRAADSFPTLTSGPEQTEALARAFDAAYEPMAAEHVRAYAGAVELLEGLKSAGVRVGVVTSKTSFRRAIDGAACGLDPLIDLFVTGDDVTKGKPDPEGLRWAMAELGGAIHDTVYVGDGPVDARTGSAAGVATILVSQGLHAEEEFVDVSPDLVVKDLFEVAAALGYP